MVCFWGTTIDLIKKIIPPNSYFSNESWLIYKLTTYIHKQDGGHGFPNKVPDNGESPYTQWFYNVHNVLCKMHPTWSLGDTLLELECSSSEEKSMTIFDATPLDMIRDFQSHITKIINSEKSQNINSQNINSQNINSQNIKLIIKK